MKVLIRRGALLLCLTPGTIATLFMVLAIANGGTLWGLSTKWLLNCSVLAVPPLTVIVIGMVLILVERDET